MKKCNKCEKEKPLNEFHKNKNLPGGHQHQCKACNKLAKDKWRDTLIDETQRRPQLQRFAEVLEEWAMWESSIMEEEYV